MAHIASPCVVCDSRTLGANAVVDLGSYQLHECMSCGSWTLLPRLDSESQAALHDTDAYFEHPYFRGRRNATAALRRRIQEMLRRLLAVQDLDCLKGERVLDVGCDTGDFLQALERELGIVPIGVDVSSRVIKEAQLRGIQAYHADLLAAPTHLRQLALITGIDLLEHVPHPRRFLEEVCARLRPGGVAYLETPNPASIVYEIGRRVARVRGRWGQEMLKRLFPLQHAQYLSRRAFSTLARACGFDDVRIDTRVLPSADISASPVMRFCLAAVQTVDTITGERILTCATLRKKH